MFIIIIIIIITTTMIIIFLLTDDIKICHTVNVQLTVHFHKPTWILFTVCVLLT